MGNKLFIGGSSQNVGKTTFIIDLLKEYSSKHEIIAIKTSCHFHGILDTDIIIANTENFVIVKETITNSGKDTARMLEAGASEVYFIQAKDKFIAEAYNFLQKKINNKINNNAMMVCESASLRNFVIPEIFIALTNYENETFSDSKLILSKADIVINNYLGNKKSIKKLVEKHIGIKNNKWIKI